MLEAQAGSVADRVLVAVSLAPAATEPKAATANSDSMVEFAAVAANFARPSQRQHSVAVRVAQ